MKKNIFLLFAAVVMTTTGVNAQNYKGDVNKDGSVDVSDVTALVDIILSGASPETEEAALQEIIDELQTRITSNLGKIEAETIRAKSVEDALKARQYEMDGSINDNSSRIALLEKNVNAVHSEQQAATEYVESLIDDETNEREKADAAERAARENAYQAMAAALNEAFAKIAECEAAGKETSDAVSIQNARLQDLEIYTETELNALKAEQATQNANFSDLFNRFRELAISLDKLEDKVAALEGKLQ